MSLNIVLRLVYLWHKHFGTWARRRDLLFKLTWEAGLPYFQGSLLIYVSVDKCLKLDFIALHLHILSC